MRGLTAFAPGEGEGCRGWDGMVPPGGMLGVGGWCREGRDVAQVLSGPKPLSTIISLQSLWYLESCSTCTPASKLGRLLSLLLFLLRC